MNSKPAYCFRCGKATPTIILHLSSGHLGNCCDFCHSTRKGHPFISRRKIQATNAVTNGRRDANAPLPIRKS